ncbi:MAG: phosphoribosylamine--glycine ligase [Phycisphaerae bacterium]
MNILVIGGGGREHAVCRSLATSPRLTRLFVMPGNAGTGALGTNIAVDPCDTARVVEFARRESIDLTIVGPEDPLAAGLVDALEAAGLRVFGPTRAAARLEWDKAWAKQLMRQAAVPTGEARVFDDFALAEQYIATRDDALVIKAAGLAKGKGVVVCRDPAEALLSAEQMLVKRSFGEAGARIVVEERLEGREVSVLALVDGQTLYVLPPAQDYKRLRDADDGPNTGGMGAYCPSDAIDPDTMRQVEQLVLVPTLDALAREGIRYRGVLYAGLMLTAAGPKVLEFNCRFGDPEAQVILSRLRSDLLDVFDACVSGRLDENTLRWDARHAVCVVMAAAGYPESVKIGAAIRDLPEPADDCVVYHAGTRRVGGTIFTSGGRVLGVTALGETRAAARARAYDCVRGIAFDGAQFRTDIGAAIANSE